MTGPEHYRMAQQLLTGHAAYDIYLDKDGNRVRVGTSPPTPEAVARAQVHATLALAAASAMPTVSKYMGHVDPASGGDSQEITAWGHTIGWSTAVDAGTFPAEQDGHPF